MSIFLQSSEYFLSKYKDKPVELLTQIFEDEASSSYELITNYVKCKASIINFEYIHELNSMKFFSPKVEMIEAYSKGKMARLGEKFIHRFDNRIESIETDSIENYKNSPILFSDYDSYIKMHGKLFMRKYYATKSLQFDTKMYVDKFLTFDETVYKKSNERSKHVIYSTVPYQIYDGDILNYSLSRNDDGEYIIKLKLNPIYSNDYYAFEIIHRGALFDYPKFISTDVTFILNNRFELIRVDTIDNFIAKSGIVTANLLVESTHLYHHSNNNTFKLNGKNIKIDIPSNAKKDFSLFSLLKAK